MGMLVGFNRPVIEMPYSWTITSGTTCSFLTSANALTDDSVASVTRIHWANSEVSNDAFVEILATMPTQNIRVAGLMGVTLPVNTLVKLVQYNVSPYAVQAQNRVIQLPDGSRAVWFVLAAPVSMVNVGFQIMNDIGSGNFVPHPIDFDIGEAWFSNAYEYPIFPTKKLKILNDGTVRRSTNGQPFPLLRRDYRQIMVDLVPQIEDVAYGTAASSWANLRGSLAKANPCAVIPWYRDSSGSISQVIATEQALFGWCSNRGEIDRRNDARMYNLSLQFDEYPPSTI